MLSRVHCSIEYRESIGWIIRDGYSVRNKDGSYENKNSTNGTWYVRFYNIYNIYNIILYINRIYAMEDTMIYEGMVFKANHNLFECHYA